MLPSYKAIRILVDEAMVLLDVTNTVGIYLLGSDSYGMPSAQLQFGLGWESVVYRSSLSFTRRGEGGGRGAITHIHQGLLQWHRS